MSWLTDDIVAAVCRHMNDDHAAETLSMAQAVDPAVVSAEVSGLDISALVITAHRADGSRVDIPLPWARELQDRADIRNQIVEMYQAAAPSAD